MTSLIITLIGIALVAVTAVIALFTLGDTFNSGKERAEAGRAINEASFIHTASTLYETHNFGRKATSISDLVDSNYLKSAPKGLDESWFIFNQNGKTGFATITENEKIAQEAMKNLGQEDMPYCEDIDLAGKHIVCILN